MLVYNKKLKPFTEDIWLDTVDVAGTLTQYIRGASIPAESNGVGHAASETLSERIAFYSHTSFQLVQNAKYLGVRLGSIVSRFGPDSDYNLNPKTAKDRAWQNYLRQLKHSLEEFHSIPVTSIGFYLFAALGTFISLINLEFGTFRKFCAMLSSRFWLIIVPIFIVFGYPAVFSMVSTNNAKMDLLDINITLN
jgi:hypothetical protein